MNTEMKQIAEEAFDGIADVVGQIGVFSGTRRESGASESRPLTLSAVCTLSKASSVDLTNLSSSPSSELSYTVNVGRTAWPDHLPPQAGDSVLFDDIPVLKVSVVMPAAYGWSLTCIGGAA
jgi:hypothetical protein